MQARPERRDARRLRHGGYDARPAGQTAHRQTPMMRDEGLHRGQLDPLVYADRLGQQVRAERHSTAGALARTGLDNRIGRLAHHPTVALMAGLGPAGLGFLPLLLAIRRGRLSTTAGVHEFWSCVSSVIVWRVAGVVVASPTRRERGRG